MELTINKKTYTVSVVKSRMLRTAIELSERVEFNNLKVAALDELVDFICILYGGKFTRDEFYDGVDANKLIDTLTDAINGVAGGMTNELSKFPTK